MKSKLLLGILALGIHAYPFNVYSELEQNHHSFATRVCIEKIKAFQYLEALNFCQQGASQDDPIAQNHLGEMYFKGQGVVPNNTLALKWFSKSASKEYAPGQFNLGKMYAIGLEVKKDPALAARYFQKAASSGHLEASFALSLCYALGFGVPKSQNLSLQWYNQAAQGQYFGAPSIEAHGWEKALSTSKASSAGKAEYQKGLWAQLGIHESSNITQALRWFKQSAQLGYPDGQVTLGILYHLGQGVKQDEEQALLWFKKAAEQKSAKAHYYLSWFYLLGIGVPQDNLLSLKWFKSPHLVQVSQTNQVGLSEPFEDSIASTDSHTSLNWHQKAAQQGDQEAQYALAHLYFKGKKVERDDELGYHWLKISAENGYAKAQFEMGEHRLQKKDFKTAAHWYKKAASKGEKNAQYQIGMMYLRGQGVPQSYIHAYAWINIASANGSLGATQARELLVSQMTPDEVLQAQALSKEMFLEHPQGKPFQQKVTLGVTP